MSAAQAEVSDVFGGRAELTGSDTGERGLLADGHAGEQEDQGEDGGEVGEGLVLSRHGLQLPSQQAEAVRPEKKLQVLGGI